MSTNAKIGALALALLLVGSAVISASVASGAARFSLYGDEYVDRYFRRDQIMQVNIEIDEADFKYILANAPDEEFRVANVTINGDLYRSVRVRAKGNSSLRSVAQSGGNRFSFKINFGKLVKGQTMAGVTQLNLNNNFADPSYMREFLGYTIFEEMGVAAPAFAYAAVHVNGEYWGLYLAVESILEPYLERNFGNITGDLYKSVGGAGSTLAYSGASAANYAGLELKSKRKNAEWNKLTDMLYALQTGEDLEKHLDVDAALRYLAVSTALLNFDSYQGNFAHNYYLYEQNGVFTILVWDLNMSFGGFNMGSSVEQMQSVPIDEPVSGRLADRPLIAALLANDEYRARYHTYLEEIATRYLGGDYLPHMTAELHDLIAEYVRTDPTAFYTYEQFEENIVAASGNARSGARGGGIGGGVPGILQVATAMSEGITKQLSGELPSTNNGNGMSGASRGGWMPGVAPGEMPEGAMPGQIPGGIPRGVPNVPGQWQRPEGGAVPDPAGGQPQDPRAGRAPGERLEPPAGGQIRQPGQLPQQQPGQGRVLPGVPAVPGGAGPGGAAAGRQAAAANTGAGVRWAASVGVMTVATGLVLPFRRRRLVRG
ncbi:MAG: CotH kinase family protein [Bacillota bacterium]|nr:CotH kinase family protein [Bacillota bacterium]